MSVTQEELKQLADAVADKIKQNGIKATLDIFLPNNLPTPSNNLPLFPPNPPAPVSQQQQEIIDSFTKEPVKKYINDTTGKLKTEEIVTAHDLHHVVFKI